MAVGGAGRGQGHLSGFSEDTLPPEADRTGRGAPSPGWGLGVGLGCPGPSWGRGDVASRGLLGGSDTQGSWGQGWVAAKSVISDWLTTEGPQCGRSLR